MKIFWSFFNSFFKRKVNSLIDNSSIDQSVNSLNHVGVVQFQHQNFKNWKDFQEKVLSNVKSAKDEGAQLILFPAGMNMELYANLEEKLSENQISKSIEESSKVFSSVASLENVYIAYADFVKGKRIFHLIGNNGKEMKEKVYEIHGIKIAFMDDEVDEEVKLVLNPSILRKWVGDYESFGHAWLFSQQRYVYSMESYMVGDHFIGQSGIYSPIEVTESSSGIIKQAQSKVLEEILVAEVNFDLIDEIKHKKSFNPYARLLKE